MELPIEITPLWQWWGIGNAFKSFFNQVSTRDFSILKWVLIALPIIWILIVIYMFIVWKIRITNLMFWLDYWVKFIVWDFWAWKTKNLFQYWFLWKKENPNWILIANIPYNFVDYFFDSKEDFDCIMRDLVQYIRDTNSVEFLKEGKEFPPILILWDEIHEYLFNRDFKNFNKDVRLVLTQCRKRQIEIDCISQRVSQVDVFLKRLVWIFHYFKCLWNSWIRKEVILNCLNPDSNDLNDESSYEVLEESYLLPDKFALFFHKDLKDYYSQKYLTYYVVWGSNVYADENDISLLKKWDLIYSHNYLDLKSDIMKKMEILNTPLPPKKTIFDSLFKKDDDLQQKIIEEQKKKIDALIKLIPESDLESVFGPSPLSSLLS